ncbi:hypothetical protein [Pseudomonas sp. MYb118]|uniref:hypothetical protein n=1 Tax=Pseudomonas sp. MYb118 TaxID=1848720 RepID=UPI0034CD6126
MSTKPQSAADTSSPVYICHGAEAQQCHILSITPEPDSLWMTNQIACHQIVGDTSSSISIEPALGEFQDLPATGAAFKLHCPAIGEDRDMEMWLRSGYTAKPHIINLKLGHFRCVIASSRAPIRAPVIGQTLLASVTLKSFYTQALVKGIEVEWVVDGVSTTVATNDSGVSDFQYTVVKEGKQTITASFKNPYDDETKTMDFPFIGFTDSPWKKATLKVNGHEVAFGKTAALIRAQANEVTVEIPEDIARMLTLAVVDPGGLTLTASPEFGASVPVVDGKVSWQVTSAGDLRGLVTLAIYSADVDLPWELVFAVMSDDLADEVEGILVDDIVSPPAVIWFFRNEPGSVTLKYREGSPFERLPLLMEAKVIAGVQPENLSVTPAGETSEHVWSVRSHTNSGTFQLELKGPPGITGFKSPPCKVISHYLEEEVAWMYLNDEPFSEKNLFIRDLPKAVVMSYKRDSPLPGYPLELKAFPVTNLQPGDLKVTNVSASPHAWVVGASSRSGTFRLEVWGPQITRNYVLPVSTVLSNNLGDEVDAKFDGSAIPADGVEFAGGTAKTLTLTPKPASPIAGQPLMLRWVSGIDLVKGEFICTPAFDAETTVHNWSIQGPIKNGTFVLDVCGDEMDNPLAIPRFTLNSSSIEEFITAIDGRLISEGATALVYRGVEYLFELVLPKNSKLIGKKVTPSWLVSGESMGVSMIPAIGTPLVLNERTAWKIAGGDIKDGLFSIKFNVEGLSQHLEAKFNLAYHQVKIVSISTDDELVTGKTINFDIKIAFSANSEFPVKNATVKVIFLGIPVNHLTDKDGMVRVPFIAYTPGKYNSEIRAGMTPENTPVVEFHEFDVVTNTAPPEPAIFRDNTTILLTEQLAFFPIYIKHGGVYFLPRDFVGILRIRLKVDDGVVNRKQVGIRISPQVAGPVFSPKLEELRMLTTAGLSWDFNAGGSLERFTLEFYCVDFPDVHQIYFRFY